MMNLNNPNTVKIIIASASVIAALILLSVITICLCRCFKNRNRSILMSKTSLNNIQDEQKRNRSDEGDILLIFGKGDQSLNNGKSNHENLKKKINEVEQSIENFYNSHIKYEEYETQNTDPISGEKEKKTGYHIINESNIIQNFQKTQFETDHDFIQYFFPSKSQSKFSPSAPYVENLKVIKALVKNNSISINDIDERFKNFSSALKFYLQTTGIWINDSEENFNKAFAFEKISPKIKNELLNGSAIQHNQLRITRMLESIDLHLSFLKFVKETFIENNDQENLKKINVIEANFNAEINEYIPEIFQYISELSKLKNNNKKKSAEFQASALLDLLIHIDENFKNKKEKLNQVEKQFLNNVNDIRKNFKANLFDNLTKKSQNEIETKMNLFISLEIKIDSSDTIISPQI